MSVFFWVIAVYGGYIDMIVQWCLQLVIPELTILQNSHKHVIAVNPDKAICVFEFSKVSCGLTVKYCHKTS